MIPDGRLLSGEPLGEAIERVDAETAGAASYFMINCAHPTHFSGVLEGAGRWIDRLGGIRVNASRMSHEELDEATELDSGDPVELGEEYVALKPTVPGIRVLGGCCGTGCLTPHPNLTPPRCGQSRMRGRLSTASAAPAASSAG